MESMLIGQVDSEAVEVSQCSEHTIDGAVARQLAKNMSSTTSRLEKLEENEEIKMLLK